MLMSCSTQEDDLIFPVKLTCFFIRSPKTCIKYSFVWFLCVKNAVFFLRSLLLYIFIEKKRSWGGDISKRGLLVGVTIQTDTFRGVTFRKEAFLWG